MGFIQIDNYSLNVSQIIYVEDLTDCEYTKNNASISMVGGKFIRTEMPYGEVMYLINKAGKEVSR